MCLLARSSFCFGLGRDHLWISAWGSVKRLSSQPRRDLQQKTGPYKPRYSWNMVLWVLLSESQDYICSFEGLKGNQGSETGQEKWVDKASGHFLFKNTIQETCYDCKFLILGTYTRVYAAFRFDRAELRKNSVSLEQTTRFVAIQAVYATSKANAGTIW